MKETCRLCEQSVMLVPDTSAPVKIHLASKKNPNAGEDSVTTAGHSSKPHEWGLCYFHHKHFSGLFDMKYPLYKYGLYNAMLIKHLSALRKSEKTYVQKLSIEDRRLLRDFSL